MRRCAGKLLAAAILGGATIIAASSAARAADGVSLTANVALTTDYMFRGISQTANGPALQGGIDATWKMFYLGLWGSNVDFGAGDPADFELDYYGGIRPSWKNLNFDLGVLFYTYPGVDASGYDVTEAKLGVSTTLWQDLSIGFASYFSDRDYQAYEFSGAYAFEKKLWVFKPSVSALIGFVQTEGSFVPANYTYGNAGVTLGFWDKPNLSIDVRYWDSDLSTAACGGNYCDSRAVATLLAQF